MSFNPITFDGKVRPASADGAVFFGALGDCALDGCNITNSGNVLTIGAGHILAGGRVIEVVGDTSYTVSPTVASGVGRLLLNIDLSSTPVFNLSEEYQSAESGFITLVTDEININGTEYQVELCRYSVSSSAISSITGTLPLATATETATVVIGSGPNQAYFRKDGKSCNLSAQFASSLIGTIADNTTLFTAPEGYRPAVQTYAGIVVGRTANGWATSNYYAFPLLVNSAGACIVRGNTSQLGSCVGFAVSGNWIV